MILKIIGIFSTFVCLHEANGASYSKVYVQNGGAEVVPVEYVNYGAPAVIAEPQIAQLSAAPVGPVVSVPSVSSVIPPCVSPCVIGQNVAPVAQVPNAKFVTYNAPNVPVVVAPSKDNGYEYSYVVYDENTGDRKAQREFSDGSVVHGEYSFIQPDGYVREVQYRADDLTGFNVVVKRILPESVGVVEKKDKDLPPCKDVKSEALKEEPKLELADAEPVQHDHDGDGTPDHKAEDHKEVSHDHDGNGVPDHDASEHVEPEEPAHEAEPAPEEPTHEELHEEPPAEPEHAPEPEEAHEPEPVAEAAPEPEHQEEPEHHDEPAAEAPEEAHEETHEAIVVPDEPAPEVVSTVVPVAVPALPTNNLVVSYEDIIRCVQSKAQSPQGLNVSPLTYIILPAANRPC